MDVVKLIPGDQVRQRYGGISEMTIHRWLTGKTGFPQPVKISGRNYWHVSDLDAFDASLSYEKGPKPGERAKGVPHEKAA
jgi:predicted DNA-binding transcriptional regulator AlpA